MTHALNPFGASAFHNLLSVSERFTQTTFRIPTTPLDGLETIASPLLNRCMGIGMAITSVAQFTEGLKPIIRVFKAVLIPHFDSAASMKEAWIRSGIGLGAGLSVSIIKVVYAAIHIILPEINAVLPLRKGFVQCYCLYKAMQLDTIPDFDRAGIEWRFSFAFRCANAALQNPSESLSFIVQEERILDVFMEFNAFQGMPRRRLQEVLRQMQRRNEDLYTTLSHAFIHNRYRLQEMIQPLLQATQQVQVRENQRPQRIQQAPVQFQADSLQNLGSHTLLQTLSNTHALYVENEWYSEDDISGMTQAFYPALNTASLTFIWDHLTVEEGELERGAKNTLQFGNSRFQYSHPYPNQHPFSPLESIECQKLMKSIRHIIDDIQQYNWGETTNRRVLSKEEYMAYFNAFFLHEGAPTDNVAIDTLSEEEQRKHNRGLALQQTAVENLLKQNDVSENEKVIQQEFLQKVRELEVSIATFRNRYFEAFITGRNEWRGRQEGEIRRVFYV